MLQRFLYSLMVTSFFVSSIAAHSETDSAREFEGFPSVRAEVLSIISGATQSIRIATDFLSDGEIVSALYIAQYRKVTVQVLLGQSKATHILSRLSYLKAQNVPTYLRPRGFMPGYPTIIQADQKLYVLNADLDYMAKHRRFTLKSLPESQINQFVDTFTKAQTEGVTPEPKTLPLVGRARNGSSAYQGPEIKRSQQAYKHTPVQPYSPEPSQDGSTVFRYTRNKEKPSAGIATKLPKSTILQQRMGSTSSEPKDKPSVPELAKEPEAVQ
jgi:hypothetical protein